VTGEVITGFQWGKPDGKRQLARPTQRWKDNIKMGLQEMGWGDKDWNDRAWWQAPVNEIMNLWVPQNAGIFLTTREPVSF
jgi:hypothetical protein